MTAGISGQPLVAPLIASALLFAALGVVALLVRVVRRKRPARATQQEHREGFVEGLATNWLFGRLVAAVEKLMNLWL